MPTLSPRQTYDVAVERPVEQPSALQALSGLIDAGLRLGAQAAAQDNLEPNLELGLIRGLEEAQQLRLQGDEQGALQMERRVRINYGAAGGDFNSGATQQIVAAYTGQAADNLGFTPEERLARELGDPDSEMGRAFNQALLAAQGMNPDATDEEQQELAMSLMVQAEANRQLEVEAQFNWNNATRGAMLDRIDTFGNVALGAMQQIAKQGGVVRLEDIQAVRASFLQFRAELEAKRPPNIDNEQWGQITAALDARQELIETIEEMAGPGNLDARAATEFVRMIEGADVPELDKNLMVRLFTSDPGMLLDRGIFSATRLAESGSEVVRYAQTGANALQPGDLSDPNRWDVDVMEDANGNPLDVQESLKHARSSIQLMNAVPTASLQSNTNTRNTWGEVAVRGMSSIMNMSSQGRYAAPQEINALFSNKFFQDLETIRAVDPGLYNNLVVKANRVLSSQAQVIGQKMSVIGQDSPFEYNVNTGEFRLTRERAEQVMDAREFRDLDRAVDEFYDGDWSALMSDNGARIYDDFNNPAITAWQRISGTRNAVPDNLRTIGAAYHATSAALRKTGGLQPAQISSRGNYTEGANTTTMLHQMVDATEASGDYGALFGFSNRPGKAFQHVDITNMTIGELKNFSSESGAYGRWSVQQLGYRATPMGRYQFVGTTLASVAERMGLSDDTLFTPEIQDAMFHFHVSELIEGKDDRNAARILKDTWEGFKSYTDAELEQAVANFRGTPAPPVISGTRGGVTVDTLTTNPLAPGDPAQEGTDGPFDVNVEGPTGERAELDETTTEATPERGEASRQVVEEERERIIQEFMERYNVTRRQAERMFEIQQEKQT